MEARPALVPPAHLRFSDWLPRRQSHLGRLLDLFAEMPLHAFFGVIVMMATTPLVPVFAAPPTWEVDPMEDQWLAGALAWSYGELPAVLLVLVILGRWYRQESAQARAQDWADDRRGTESAQLRAYNEYLRHLNGR